MKQTISFEVKPTQNPDEAVGHARCVINADSGIGMDVLLKVVEDHVPAVDHPEVQTCKTIIRTSRYECPCCNTDLTALVRVNCSGRVLESWNEVEGLYRVSIAPDHGKCEILVEKFSGATVFKGKTEGYLPRKDYESNPQAKAELEERDRFFTALAQRFPGRVMSVGGVETAEDLQNMVRSVTDQISKK